MKLIEKISLKFGASDDSAKLELAPTGITLFVGPNNSGKSLVLREIEKCCATHNKSGNLILDNIRYSIPDRENILKDLKSKETEPNKNENVPDGSIVVHRINTYQGLKQREIVPLNQIPAWVEANNIGALARYYISLHCCPIKTH